MTPDQVHHGQVDAIYAARQSVLDRAFTETPQRFVRATPQATRQAHRGVDQPASENRGRPSLNSRSRCLKIVDTFRIASAGDSDLGGLATGVTRDRAAVAAAITEPWSMSPVEGHINRSKTLKRQMYGRAGYQTLRAGILAV